MGTEHSTISMRDALSQVRSQRDVDVPHTIASISKSISSGDLKCHFICETILQSYIT